MHSDPIADMLTRIRNAEQAGRESVLVKASKVCQGIAEVLRNEGYICSFDKIDDATGQGLFRIQLKYSDEGTPAITEIKRVSRNGRRVYSSVKTQPCVMNGMGIAIVSTSKGVMTDKQCRDKSIGGELI